MLRVSAEVETNVKFGHYFLYVFPTEAVAHTLIAWTECLAKVLSHVGFWQEIGQCPAVISYFAYTCRPRVQSASLHVC